MPDPTRPKTIAPEDDAPSDGAPSPAVEESAEGKTEKKPSLEWRRKARSRRMQANRPAGSGDDSVPVKDFEPVFTARRMPDLSLEFDRASDGEPGSLAPDSKPPADNRWNLLMAAGGALAVVLATAVAVVLGWQNDAGSKPQSGQTDSGASPATPEQSAIRAAVDMVPRARRTLELFFAASTPEQKTAFVRGGPALLPAMQAYYTSHPDEPEKLLLSSSVEFAADAGRDYIVLTGADAAGAPINAVVEITPDGPRLDWRYLTGAGDLEWDQWIAQRPAGPVGQRILASLDDYYAEPFADRRKWISLKITNATRTVTAWAYAKKGSPAGSVIRLNLTGRRTPVRFQGQFEFPAESQTDSPARTRAPLVSITSLESGWFDRTRDETTALGQGP